MEVLSRPSFGCFVTLRLEFNVGELGLWGSNGGIPTMDGPRNQCQIDGGCLEDGGESEGKQ